MNKRELQKERRFVLTQRASKQYPFYPPTVTIPGACEVYDPKTDKQRTAVYMPGQNTIWADEIESLKNEKRIEGKSILIKNGVISVSARESNKLKYLEVAGYNEANTDTRINSAVLYRELDVERLAEKSFEDSKKLDNARYFVNNNDIKEVRAYGLALAKNNADYKAIQDMSEYEVRVYMRGLAEKNPSLFIDGMQQESLRNKVRIIHAIYSDVLVLNESERTLSWKNGSTFITAPSGLDVVVYFAEMAIDNPKYKEAFDTMTTLMKQDKTPVDKSEKVERQELKSIQETLIDNLLEKEVVTCSGNNTWFKYKKGKEELKWKSKKIFIEALKEDKELLAELMTLAF